jgi:hypothetical protein
VAFAHLLIGGKSLVLFLSIEIPTTKIKTVLRYFMIYSPIAIKRSYVLGNIYNQCDAIESIPVYLDDKSGELLGYVDESLGHYADAFTFHLSEIFCKQLSSSHYDYAFGFEYSENTEQTVNKKRIKLNHILLIGKKPAFNKVITSKEAIY